MIKKLLVVDDEPLIAEGISNLIESFDLPLEITRTVFSSEEALAICQNETIDIVVTDINMPVINGLELIKRIRATNPRTQLIILTGFGTLDYAKEAMSLGLRFFLEKPVIPVKLRDAISESMDLSDQRDIENRLWIKRFIDHSANQQTNVEDWPKILKCPFQIISFHSSHYHLIAEFIKEKREKNNLITGHVNNVGYIIINDTMESVPLLFEALCKDGILKKGVCFTESIAQPEDIKHFFKVSNANFDKEYYFDSPQLFDSKLLRDDGLVYKNETFEHFKIKFQQLLDWGELTNCKILIKSFFENCKETLYPVKLLQLQVNDLLDWLFKQYSLKKDHVFDDYSLKVILLSECNELEFLLIHGVDLFEKQTNIANNASISQQVNLIIEKYYKEEALSLKWISNNILFMNAEYIGKVYSKETGEKFNHNLLKYRMEKAIELLKQEYKVYEIATAVGYNNSPEYFVQQFKKYVGKTPKQYINDYKSQLI